MKQCLIHLVVDITPCLPEDWQKMSAQEIREWIGDIPECVALQDENIEYVYAKDGYMIHKVEKILQDDSSSKTK